MRTFVIFCAVVTSLTAHAPTAAQRVALNDAARTTAPVRRTIVVPPTQSGGVAAAAIPLGAGQDVHWRVEPAAAVRVLGPASGLISATDAADGLALTFGLPRAQPAGTMVLARVDLRSARGEEQIELVTTVAARRGLEVTLDLPDSARAGTVLSGRLRVRNVGTATDTVALRVEFDLGWRVEGLPTRLVLAQRETQDATFRVRIPATAVGGSGVRATARGEGGPTVTNRAVGVVGAHQVDAERRQLVTTVTLGLATADAGNLGATRASFGVSAAGEITDGTYLDVLAQENEVGAGVIVYPGVRSQSLLRARMRSRDWQVTLGDAVTRTGLLPRFFAAGRGGEASLSNERFDLRAAYLLPRVGWGVAGGEHVLTAGAAAHTNIGRVGIALLEATHAEAAQDDVVTGHSAALQYQLLRGGHVVQAEAGWLASRSAAGRQGGLAAEATYAFDAPGAAVNARFRHAPETALLGAGVINEAAAGAVLGLGRGFIAQADAHAYRTATGDFTFLNDLGDHRVSVGPGARGLSAGLLWRGDATTAGGSAHVLRRESAAGSELRRTLAVQAGRALGTLALHATLEAGEKRDARGEIAALQRLRGTVSWSGTAGSIWASAEQSTESAPLAIAVNAALRVRGVELSSMLNTTRDSLALPTTTFSSTISIPLARAMSATASAEHRPWAAGTTSPWAVSVGVRRSFGVPLPGRTAAPAHGVVFDDRDADGVQDSDEPGVADVPVSLGSAHTRTDALGRFRLPAHGGHVVVSERTLPLGVMVRPGTRLQAGEALSIPLVRTGDATVLVTLQDGAIGVPAAGLTVRVVDAAGAVREGVTDSAGVASFAALVPGAARVTVLPPASRPRQAKAAEQTLQLQVAAGETANVSVAFEHRSRPVRY